MGRYPERTPEALAPGSGSRDTAGAMESRRTTEAVAALGERKQRRVSLSHHVGRAIEGAADAHCWSNVKKNRWLEMCYVLSDIPSSAEAAAKTASCSFPLPRVSLQHTTFAQVTRARLFSWQPERASSTPRNIHISLMAHIRWHYDDCFMIYSD